MANTVFIRIHKEDSLDMYLADGQSIVLSKTDSSLDEIANACRGKKLVVFIPGNDVHLAMQNIPIRNRQKVLQAIPYSMEDDLIGDVSQFHFAIPARLPADAIPVCAIARNRLDHILTKLAEYRLHPQVIMADSIILPCRQGQWNLIIEDQESSVQTGEFSAFSADTDSLEAYLDMALEQANDDAPGELNIIDARTDALQPLLEDIDASSMEISRSSPPASLLELLVKNYQDGAGINLLQGAYASRKVARQSLKKWYPAAAMLAIVVVIQAVSFIAGYISLSEESEQLQSQINQVFRKALPDVKNIRDPRNQMQQRLSALKGNSQAGGAKFLQILSKFSNAMQADRSISLTGVNFRNGQVDIELAINDLQALEKLKQSVSQSGLTVDIRSAAVQGKTVSARLRIQESS